MQSPEFLLEIKKQNKETEECVQSVRKQDKENAWYINDTNCVKNYLKVLFLMLK